VKIGDPGVRPENSNGTKVFWLVFWIGTLDNRTENTIARTSWAPLIHKPQYLYIAGAVWHFRCLKTDFEYPYMYSQIPTSKLHKGENQAFYILASSIQL
jgi:hypothetical protein